MNINILAMYVDFFYLNKYTSASEENFRFRYYTIIHDTFININSTADENHRL